ncbi:MAG: divergent polysaccharide deacetylase family protein [Candidatus Omnitrophota bacterium]|jgi:hypothetical protein
MPQRHRSKKSGSPDTIKNVVIAILFSIVIFETILLARVYVPGFRPKIRIPERTSLGKVAIIIDDNGYNMTDCNAISQINAPITVSVLPHLKYSQEIAHCAHNQGKEVMLHLPLEPHQNNDTYPGNYIITTVMPPSLVIQKFNEALASVPHAKGINNHMGSKATEDTALMSILFTQMKINNLYFVDSRVTRKTICPLLASQRHLPFAERDVFLDNKNDRTYIEQQFRELRQTAVKHGYAIGICHARALTWDILKEQIDLMTSIGYEIVPVKSIINSL